MELGVDIYFEIPTVTTRYSKTTTPPAGGPRVSRACAKVRLYSVRREQSCPHTGGCT
jgi:hypothetical protein